MVTGHNKSKIKFIFLILLFAFFLSIAIYFYSSGKHIEIRDVQNLVSRPHYFVAFYTAISFIPIPFVPVLFVGGFVFPFFNAVFYTLIGSVLFAIITFFVSRYLGKSYYQYLESKNEKMKKFNFNFREDPFENVLLLRFFFIIPSEFVNVYAGISRLRFKDFLLATILGNIPLVICSVGLIRGNIKGDMFSMVASLIGLFVILMIPILFSGRIKVRAIRFIKSIRLTFLMGK